MASSPGWTVPTTSGSATSASPAGLLRQATEDTEVDGQPIAAGDYVVAAVQSADRDPAVHRDGDMVDIARAC